MPELIFSLFGRYGILLVFVNVLLVQLGLPIPAVPTLIVAGGLAAAGKFNLFVVIAAAVAASALADYSWYLTGRRLGTSVLIKICRLALSPDQCMRKAEIHYARWGICMLLFAKFMPGAAIIAPPLAGVLHMPRHLFLLYAVMGGSMWAGTYVALGYFLDVQADVIAPMLTSVGVYTALASLVVLTTYILVHLRQRWCWLRMVETTRTSVEQVQELLSAPAGAVLIDIRSASTRDLVGRQLPNKLVIDVNKLDVIVNAIPNSSTSSCCVYQSERDVVHLGGVAAQITQLPARVSTQSRHRRLGHDRTPDSDADNPLIA